MNSKDSPFNISVLLNPSTTRAINIRGPSTAQPLRFICEFVKHSVKKPRPEPRLIGDDLFYRYRFR